MTHRRGLTLVELLATIGIVGLLVALLLPAVQSARESGRRAVCAANAKQIATALHTFHQANGTLPWGQSSPFEYSGSYSPILGPAQVSWLTPLLPYVELRPLSDQQASLTGVAYAWPVSVKPFLPMFVCPSITHAPKLGVGPTPDTNEGFHGNYAGCFSGTNPKAAPPGTSMDGVLFPQSRVSFAHVKDGASNTLLIGEILTHPDPLDRRGRYYNAYSATVLFSSYYAPNTSVPDNIQNVAARCVSQPGYPCTASGGSALYARSYHSGGVTVALLDASVRFVANDVNETIFQALGSRRGGEPVGEW